MESKNQSAAPRNQGPASLLMSCARSAHSFPFTCYLLLSSWQKPRFDFRIKSII
jgi:hypothetical protein